jgi:hypothetical protein
VFISWDDSDGWYGHVMGPILIPSNDPAQDTPSGKGSAGAPATGVYLDRDSYSLSGNSVASWGGVCYAAAFPDSCFGVASSLTLDLQGCLLSP